MRSERSRLWVVIVLTFVTGLLVFSMGGVESIANKRFYEFPLSTGDWGGEEIPMGPNIYASLETPYAFLRNYGSQRYPFPVNFAVVWFDDRYIAFHAPEACLGGVGNLVKEKNTIPLRINGKMCMVGRMVVEWNGLRQLVIFYYDSDGFITTSQSALRLRILLKRLAFQRSSVTFNRIMIPIAEKEVTAREEAQAFLDSITPLMPSYVHTSQVIEQK